MKKKKLRIKIEYELTVEEFDDLTAARRLGTQRSNKDYCETVVGSGAWENIRRQKRLQLALLNNKELIEEYMLHVAAEQFGVGLDVRESALSQVVDEPDSLEVLRKAVELLDDEKDREFYGKLTSRTPFVEHVEVICDTTRGTYTNLELEWFDEEVTPTAGEAPDI